MQALQNLANQIKILNGPDLFTPKTIPMETATNECDNMKEAMKYEEEHARTVCDVSRFIQVQKAFVADAVQRDVTRLLRGLLKEAISAVLAGLMEDEALELIKEPSSTPKKRTHYMDCELQIKEVLKEISSL